MISFNMWNLTLSGLFIKFAQEKLSLGTFVVLLILES